MNISVWFEKRLLWCLVELLLLKVPISCFDLEFFLLVVLNAKSWRISVLKII
jgi:hypothetical protein